jgi:antitoxin MazE
MQVAKWGNSLAVRLPAAVVQALDLKAGEEIELHVVGTRGLEVARKLPPAELLTRLRRLRGNAINLRLSGSACSSGGNPEVSRVSSYAERSGPV